MKLYNIVLLCGGLGKRYNTSFFLKPLNYIYGHPMFYYSLLPFKNHKLFIAYNQSLEDQNFTFEVLKYFPQTSFYKIPYITRGAVETAYLTVKHLPIDPSLPILFFDNDAIYDLNTINTISDLNPFIGYSITNNSEPCYCYLQLDSDSNVIAIKEKEVISSNYGIGIYGFPNNQYFLSYAKQLLNQELHTKNEFYFSTLFQFLITSKQIIQGIHFLPPSIIGTPKQAIQVFQTLPYPKCRFCFDLDNTLVTYPVIPNDYTTCKPIPERIEFLRRLYNEGHTIIIHTARRMQTHQGNIGKTIQDIGMITLQQLNEFQIPYHEFYFGKPYADFYIDDKAINPFVPEWKHWMGFLDESIHHRLINQLPTNNLNQIHFINESRIQKCGPSQYLLAQAHYLQQVSKISIIQKMFPEVFSVSENENQCCIEMEYIHGIPIYQLYQEGLLTEIILKRILQDLEQIHSIPFESSFSLVQKIQLIQDTWLTKLIQRLENPIYKFIPSNVIQTILTHLQNYCSQLSSKHCVDIIHGDFWFSNMIQTFTHQRKYIDPRGKLNQTECLFGDPYYDYAKLYQSILGYDCILYERPLPDNYNEIKQFVETYFHDKHICLNEIQWITRANILGTIPFIDNLTPHKISRILTLLDSPIHESLQENISDL